MLRKWALDSTQPVIAAGDFNFDYELKLNWATLVLWR